MFCNLCHKELIKDGNFCHHCGHPSASINDASGSNTTICADPGQAAGRAGAKSLGLLSYLQYKEKQQLEGSLKINSRGKIGKSRAITAKKIWTGLKKNKVKLRGTMRQVKCPSLAGAKMIKTVVINKHQQFNQNVFSDPRLIAESTLVDENDKALTGKIDFMEMAENEGLPMNRLKIYLEVEFNATSQAHSNNDVDFDDVDDDLPDLTGQINDRVKEEVACDHSSAVYIVSDGSDDDLPESANLRFPIMTGSGIHEEEQLQTALELSYQQAHISGIDTETAPQQLDEEDVLRQFGADAVTSSYRRLVVDRKNVWNSAVSAWKLPTIGRRTGHLLVKFIGDHQIVEPSADVGGPRREFFFWLLQDIKERSGLFSVDSDGIPHLRRNIRHLDDGLYQLAGEMLATMVAQGGPKPQLFSESSVDYLVTLVQDMKPSLGELSSPLAGFLQQMLDASDEGALRALMQEGLANELKATIDGLPVSVTMASKEDFIDLVLKSKFMEKKPYLDQFMLGLNHYGFLDMVRKTGLKHILSKSAKKPSLTSAQILELLRPAFSNTQAKKCKEMCLITNFETFMMYLEDGSLVDILETLEVKANGIPDRASNHELLIPTIRKLKPQDVLAFVTGATSVPCGGWCSEPFIEFDHNSVSPYCRASTCALKLIIPVNRDTQVLNKFLFYFSISVAHGATFSDI